MVNMMMMTKTTTNSVDGDGGGRDFCAHVYHRCGAFYDGHGGLNASDDCGDEDRVHLCLNDVLALH